MSGPQEAWGEVTKEGGVDSVGGGGVESVGGGGWPVRGGI
jgi:hypothetical protein